MIRRNRTRLLAAAALVALSAALGPVWAQTPSFFPAGMNLDTNAYTLRMSGSDRYATAGALGIVHTRNSGSAYPFNSAQRDSTSVAWGLFDGSCIDFVVAITAGDTSADALTASSIADAASFTVPSGAGTVTFPVSDPVMMLTNSAREGATTLNANTLAAMQKIKEQCTNFHVVIFGGTAAVPTGAESQIDVVNGTGNVYRIGGEDRFETAQEVAFALGKIGSGLPEVTDYTDAASAASGGAPTTRNDVVFLAEGLTGADALAIGSVAAQYGAPVILTNTASLPDFSMTAIQTLDPETIVVLGGTEAISGSVATAAASAPSGGATVVRIGGADRYETGLLLSQRFFGIYTANAAASGDFSNQAFGFALSAGSGSSSIGWPDALASAWFLDQFDDISKPVPQRLAPPAEDNANPSVNTIGGAHTVAGSPTPSGRTPLLLVQQGALPVSVDSYLDGLWPTEGNMKTGTNEGGANNGGFGFLFGGTAVIASSVQLAVAENLSGDTYTSDNRSDLTPAMSPGLVFYTALNFTGYTSADEGGVDDGSTGAGGTDDKVCVFRNGLVGAQFLALYTTAPAFHSANAVDYQNTGSSFPVSQSRFTCRDADTPSDPGTGTVFGVSLSGHETASKSLEWATAANLLSQPGGAVADTTADVAPTSVTGNIFGEVVEGSPASATYTWSGSAATAIIVQYKSSTPNPPSSWTLSVNIARTDDPGGSAVDRITMSGTFTVTIAGGATVVMGLNGESAATATPLKFAGFYNITAGTLVGPLGGFRLTVADTGADGPTATDGVSDVIVSGNA